LEATAVALEYAWEHWDRMTEVANPAGYLYRLGLRRSRRFRSSVVPLLWEAPVEEHVRAEPKLAPALKHLSRHQRIAVVLIDGFEWTYQEVADLLGVGRSTVQQHHQRALTRLRDELGVSVDV
jgi:DNA-directed RNA polymerase specialized sigma24 family protein